MGADLRRFLFSSARGERKLPGTCGFKAVFVFRPARGNGEAAGDGRGFWGGFLIWFIVPEGAAVLVGLASVFVGREKKVRS